MKLTGLTLLLLGFGWLLCYPLLLDSTLLAIVSKVESRWFDGGRRESFSRNDLHEALFSVWRVSGEQVPRVFWPAALMFGGGLLIAFSDRRRPKPHA